MEHSNTRPKWVAQLKDFDKPILWRAVWQLVNSLVPYTALVILMYLTTVWALPVWVTLVLAFPAAAFLVRIFVIFHDCVHGSFFASQKANHIVGTILGFFHFTAYRAWQKEHGTHHSTSGNLDRSALGEIWTLTVDEYRKKPWYIRLWYRVYRNPVFLFGVAPLLQFILVQRIPRSYMNRRQKRSVWITNIIIAAIVTAASLTIGLGTYLLIQLPIMYLAGMAGLWLFYIQHQFDPGYWERKEEWNSVDSAMEGSSYYKLPAVLQWFSANIGLHHVHHLRPRIPNYNLQRTLNAIPELRLKDYLSLRTSLNSVRLNLWDEANKHLIPFKELGLKGGA